MRCRRAVQRVSHADCPGRVSSPSFSATRVVELCVVDPLISHQSLIRSQVESVGEGVTSVSVVRL